MGARRKSLKGLHGAGKSRQGGGGSGAGMASDAMKFLLTDDAGLGYGEPSASSDQHVTSLEQGLAEVGDATMRCLCLLNSNGLIEGAASSSGRAPAF